MVTHTHARTSNQTQTSALVHTTRTDTATGTAVTPPPPANTQEATPDLRPLYAHSNAAPHPRSNLTSDLNTSRLNRIRLPRPPRTHPPATAPKTHSTFTAHRYPKHIAHKSSHAHSAPLRTRECVVLPLNHSTPPFHSTLPSRRQPILNSLQAHTRATTHPTIAIAPPPPQFPSVSRFQLPSTVTKPQFPQF